MGNQSLSITKILSEAVSLFETENAFFSTLCNRIRAIGWWALVISSALSLVLLFKLYSPEHSHFTIASLFLGLVLLIFIPFSVGISAGIYKIMLDFYDTRQSSSRLYAAFWHMPKMLIIELVRSGMIFLFVWFVVGWFFFRAGPFGYIVHIFSLSTIHSWGLAAIIIFMAFLMVLLPFAYISLRFQFASLSIIDKKLGIIKAFGYSYDLTSQMHWWDLWRLQVGTHLFGLFDVESICTFQPDAVVWNLARIIVYRTLQAQKNEEITINDKENV